MDRIDDHTKIVMRLHSYELMRQWPLLIDWGRVDGCIFVAEHNRQRMLGAWDIEAIGGATHVIPNLFDLSTFDRPKSPASWTLGMAGYNTVNKNPMMALDILARCWTLIRDGASAWSVPMVSSGAGRPYPCTCGCVRTRVRTTCPAPRPRNRDGRSVDGKPPRLVPRRGHHPLVFKPGRQSRVGSEDREWGGVGRAELAGASRFGSIEPTFPDSFRFDEPSRAAEHRDTRVIGRRSQARPRRACCTAQPRVARSDRRAPP